MEKQDEGEEEEEEEERRWRWLSRETDETFYQRDKANRVGMKAAVWNQSKMSCPKCASWLDDQPETHCEQ